MFGIKLGLFEPAYAQIDLKNTTLTLKDGATPTPNSLAIKIGEGNLTYTENREIIYTPDRGILDEVRLGDEIPLDVSFDFIWDQIRGTIDTAATPSIEDFLKNVGNASAFVSTDSDACRPFAVDIEIHNDPSPSSCGDEEVITLSDFRYETLDHDLREATIACTGRCNVTDATALRQTNS